METLTKKSKSNSIPLSPVGEMSQSDRGVRGHTINQLLDKLLMMETNRVTPELYTIKQNLARMKQKHPKGGLIVPENSHQVMELINQANY